MSASQTPIIPGFFPDPSICRVGDTYYLATSSFEYFPGVPIWRSTDLVGWEQIGNAFERPDQMPPSTGRGSSGIFAPTIRHHDGRFWLITTIMGDRAPEQVILNASDPAGPWSPATTTSGIIGIDPDLAWAAEDCFVTWSRTVAGGTTEIVQCRIDLETGSALEQPRQLWSGTGMRFPEAPHLHQRDGWWYLLIAEGGTEAGHCVSIARSRLPTGPFAAAPGNPILTHRSLDHPVQNTGHADLVERPDGSWALAYLGVRPRGGGRFHVNGRETFIAGVRWESGWPVVIEEQYELAAPSTALHDDFAAGIGPHWVAPGDYPTSFAAPRETGGVAIAANPGSDAPSLLCTRVRDPFWVATVDLDPLQGEARFVVRMDAMHQFGVTVEGTVCTGFALIGGHLLTMEAVHVGSSPIRLTLTAGPPGGARPIGPDVLRASVSVGDDDTQLAQLDGRYLSTEVTGGFTGRCIGIEATAGEIFVAQFDYRPRP